MEFDSQFVTHASWPAQHRAALVIIVHVDAPDLEQGVTAHETGLDYSATGFQRLLKTLADTDLAATTAWTSRALAAFPQLARIALDQGHEVVPSRHAGGNLQIDDPAFARISDVQPQGIVESLGGGTTNLTVDRTPVLPPEWIITGASGDLPFNQASTPDRASTVIPISPYWIDATWLTPDRPLPPSSLLEAWSLSLASVRAEGGLMTITLHPHISGRPGLAGQIERFLDEVIESGDVWIATASQVAKWWRERDSE